MSDVHLLAQGAGNPPDWPMVFAVVAGVLLLLVGAAWAGVEAAAAWQRRRERRAVDALLGHVVRPTPHRWFRIARSGGRHV
jgi:hypothetical protein